MTQPTPRSMRDLMNFFSTPERPVLTPEYSAFYKSTGVDPTWSYKDHTGKVWTDEKAYYKECSLV